MPIANIIYAVKGGVPSVARSNNANFYLLCYNFHSNIGYIEEKRENNWQLYTRSENLLKQYQIGGDKFYYKGASFQNCVDKLHELTGAIIEVLTTGDVLKLQGNNGKDNSTDSIFIIV